MIHYLLVNTRSELTELSDFEPTEIEAHLECGKDGEKDGDFLLHRLHIELGLATDDADDEIAVSGDGDDLQE